MEREDPAGLRRFLADGALSVADKVQDALSVTLVGSFADTDDLSAISDIDTVVIVDHLTEAVFAAVTGHFRALEEPLRERFGLELRVNDTFGPLKHNAPGAVVYHVMVYDLAGHIRHGRKSPFTCFDWQRSSLFAKASLRDLYPVRRLMPGHFLGARRSVREYLKDYDRSVVSYRHYRFLDGEAVETVAEKPMGAKDRGEFAFHILKFVMANFLKMMEGSNLAASRPDLVPAFLRWFPALAPDLPAWFTRLRERKAAHAFPPSDPALDAFIHRFLADFEAGLRVLFPLGNAGSTGSGAVHLVRHLRTERNDGVTFLGRSQDPGILPGQSMAFPHPIVSVVNSPSRRAQETARLAAPSLEPRISPLLSEIDYGLAEGHDADWLARNHPEVTRAWAAGGDPPFPGGECQADVVRRIEAFLAALPAESSGDTLVVTHNVWIRCLVGRLLGLEPTQWHRIQVPHGLPLTVRRHPHGGFLPDFGEAELAELLGGLEESLWLAQEARRDPEAAERHAFWRPAFRDSRDRRPPVAYPLPGTCLIPMAGAGARFVEGGFRTPKPLIQVDGAPMVVRAVECLPRLDRLVYLARGGPGLAAVRPVLEETHPRAVVVPVAALTEGQACTCLLGLPEAPQDQPLLIAPCDNGMAWDPAAFSALISDPSVDMVCWTFRRHLAIRAKPAAWGYVSADPQGRVQAVSVKRPMTVNPFEEDCLIGTFWFRSARLFEELARELVRRDLRVNGEFYVDSVADLALRLGRDVRLFRVDRYVSWGKPEDLLEYRKWMALEGLFDR